MGYYQCYANITADSDIGGPGVISSFLIISWVTVAVSGVFAFHDLHGWIQKHRGVGDETRESNESKNPFPRLSRVLESLCDLQVITGLGIVISGWSQAFTSFTIDYYHQQLVNLYWTLTLNAFESSRVKHVWFNGGKPDNGWKCISRRVILFFNGALAVAFQIRTVVREGKTWNANNGPCYNYLVRTSNIPWIPGLIIYCVALISLIIPKLRPLNSLYLDSIKSRRTLLKKRFNHEWITLTQTATDISLRPSFQEIRKLVFAFGRTLLSSILLVIFLLVAQGLEIWAYGDGFYPLTWLIVLGFTTWNTREVISLWKLNAHLIVGNEQSKWGFGQVLPWAMNITVLLSFVDAFILDD